MGAKPEDTQREIGRLRGDMTAAVEEVERRLRGGLRGIATSEARIGSVRAGEDAVSKARDTARDNPTLLGVAGVVAAGALAYGVYALINGRRESQKPQNRLKRGVSELTERVGEGVETSRRQIERALPHGLLLKLEPESGGYMRVRDARLDSPIQTKKEKQRGRSTVIKRFVWAGFVSVFLAVSSVMARRLADTAWRAMVHEEPPSDKNKDKDKAAS